MRTGCADLSLPSPCAFFAFLFTEGLFTTISEPGTGEIKSKSVFVAIVVKLAICYLQVNLIKQVLKGA